MIGTINGKIAVVGDCHFGIKSFNKSFFENQKSFFIEQFIPYCVEHKIFTVIQLGDFFDSRKIMDIELFKGLSELLQAFEDAGLTIISIIGNHDTYHKNTNEINAHMFFEKYKKFISIQEITKININDKKCLFVPWVLPGSDLDEFLIEATNSEYVFGHFEIKDFEVVKGVKDQSSVLSPSLIKKNTKAKIISGHYHIQSEKGQILYTGVPYQLTWNEFDTNTGFFIYDEKFKRTFIENKISKKHLRIEYMNDSVTIIGLEKIPLTYSLEDFNNNLDIIKNHSIKFIIKEQGNQEDFIYLLKDSNIKIINEDELKILLDSNNDIEMTNKDTREFISKIIQTEDSELIPLLYSLYQELDSGEKVVY